MEVPESPLVPACRVGATPDQLRREAERAVLYGACLLLLRPDARIKPELRAAVAALLPAVRAYCQGQDSPLARHAAAYADACGARAFLEQKAALYRQRSGSGEEL
ncbi:hypothetical protein [Kallotenue papyrolyticum]|uniref:hypothetical protein n=1 Tax=Kallotenue papyrolyticum TaxID=1325125 RepID=UPI0004926535|nr:hypothetical protein [Kallotenue papyrolyticum]